MELASWSLENIGTERQKTCAYVDTYKNNDLTVMTAWDGFDNTLTNHKIFQSVELPAGAYEFTAHFGDYDGQAAGSYVAAALGTSLPDTEDLASQALGYTEMQSKSGTCTSCGTLFTLYCQP